MSETIVASQNRLVHFDIAKAICIILVVIGHYVPDNMPDWYVVVHDWIYTFHMPLFMFASGYLYLFFKKEEDYSSFLFKKFKRLMIPYFVVSLIIITIKLLTQKGMYVENPVTIFSYLKMFYSPEAGYFLWFCWALFLMFVIVPFLRTKFLRTVVFVLAILWHYFPVITLTEVFCIRQMFDMLMWFMLGIGCVDYKDYLVNSLFQSKLFGWFIVSMFVVFSVLSFSILPCCKFLLPWLGIPSTMFISLCISDTNKVSWLYIVGSSSYIIYLFHTTFMGFFKSFIHKVHLEGDLFFLLGVLIVVSAGVVLPIMLHKYLLTKTKITKFLFGLK